MRASLLIPGLAALLLAAPAAAGLPRAGALVPGRSLGGVRLGEPAGAVRAALGPLYGVCRGCSQRTWYFTYRAFDEHGLAVELERGKVSAVYTLWRPRSWHAPHGLRLGARSRVVHARAGTLLTIACDGYDALVADTARARTVYYLHDGRLWGFGLFRSGAEPCR